MLIDNRLEVFHLGQTFENRRKFKACQSAIVKENAVHVLVVDELASLGDTFALAIAQDVIL